jgi:hypothetical protein
MTLHRLGTSAMLMGIQGVEAQEYQSAEGIFAEPRKRDDIGCSSFAIRRLLFATRLLLAFA